MLALHISHRLQKPTQEKEVIFPKAGQWFEEGDEEAITTCLGLEETATVRHWQWGQAATDVTHTINILPTPVRRTATLSTECKAR